MNVAELTAVPGLPECRLPEDIANQLPDFVPPAPWRTRCTAALWFGRADSNTPLSLPAAGRHAGRPLMTMGAVIEYLDSPVDGYREVLAAAAFRRGLRMLFHCPFIAVDSLASLAAGRKNWSLPKVLVAVDGQPGHSGTTTCRSKSEAPWTVTASARALSPALPMAKNFLLWQEFPSGGLHEIPARLSGRVRLALIDIDVESSHRLERLVRPGRHLGLLADTMSATLGVPRPVPIERR